MFNNVHVWKSQLLSSTILGMVLIVFSPFMAKAQVDTNDTNQLFDQLDRYSQEERSNSINQVTNVNQLRDVAPDSWAFEALRSLVDRYGCIVGYPDQTYRGGKALSRYEFAAGLNACLNQIERLIASSEAVLREDIDTINRLLQEYEAELAVLNGRVDNLEARTAFLEDHQFSTTTKLEGEVIFGISNSFGTDNDNQAIFADRVRLGFNSSFTGKDRLITRLAAGNFDRFTNDYVVDGDLGVANINDVPSSTGTQTFNVFPGDDNDVQVDKIAYNYPLELGNVVINSYVAGTGGEHFDYTPTFSPFFQDYDGGNGALSTFATQNPIYRIGGGAGVGAAMDFDLSGSIFRSVGINVGYLAGGANNPSEGSGLFNGNYGLLAQISTNIADKVDFAFTYARGFHRADSAIFGQGEEGAPGLTGTAIANLNEEVLVDAFVQGGALSEEEATAFFDFGDKTTNSYGGELAWRINNRVNFNAFFTYTDVKLQETDEDAEVWTYGGGFAFPDLFKEGTVFGLFGGVQPYLGESRVRGINVSSKVPVHLEGFFKFPLNDNISITPGAIYLIQPEQTEDSNNQVIGTIRTTFTF